MIPTCYRCHEPGHNRAECPRERDEPAAPARSAAAVKRYPEVPPRRPPEEIADAEARAAEVREAMGWASGDREARLRELARRQVAISRASGPPGFEPGSPGGPEPTQGE